MAKHIRMISLIRRKNAQLKIVKTSEDGVIEGIKFRVTRLEDSYSAEYVTNAAGEILTETLPIYADKDGATKYQYKVEELDTEETFGYQLPDSQTVELSEGEIASVSFHNKPIEIGTKATVEGEKEIDPLDKGHADRYGILYRSCSWQRVAR